MLLASFCKWTCKWLSKKDKLVAHNVSELGKLHTGVNSYTFYESYTPN